MATPISHPTLPRWAVDHLILLVGGNPLPNAVAACALLRENGHITLLHSSSTQHVATRLRNWLEARLGVPRVQIRPVPIEARSATEIYDAVKGVAESRSSDAIGLLYTGGTKPMSVHACRALREGQPHALFCDLDPGTLRLCFDESGTSAYVGQEPKLMLEDLLNLHGWRLRKPDAQTLPSRTTPLLLPVAEALRRYYTTSDLSPWWQWIQKWEKMWQDETHFKAVNKRRGTLSQKLAQLEVPLPEAASLAEVRAAMEQTLGQAASSGILRFGPAAQAAGFNDTTDPVAALCQFLHGTWLEHFLLHELQALANQFDFHDIRLGVSIEIPDDGKQPYQRTNFELDVVALRGYQLFAFSCGTSGRKKLKLKLFELFARARQIGGDEARMGLVGMDFHGKSLQQEARRDLGTQRIRVFDQRSLGNLDRYFRQELKQYIEQQIGTP